MDGAGPDPAFIQIVESSSLLLEPASSSELTELAALKLARILATRATAQLADPLTAIRASVERRKHRDHDRIVAYFEDLATEAERAEGRARTDRAALEKKLAAFAAERDAKLRVDRPTCDGCGVPSAALAFCDDRLHILCSTCLPDARGWPSCKACSG